MSRTNVMIALVLAAIGACAHAASAAPVATTSYSAAKEGPHPQSVKIADAEGGRLITVALDGLGKSVKVHRAALRCARGELETPADLARDIEIAAGGSPAGKPLPLAGPDFDAFDCTAAVAQAVAAGAELKLFVKVFPGWTPETTRLEIVHSGRPVKVPAPATGLKAFHRNGQTFLTWKEVERLIEADKATWGEIRGKLAALDTVSYRIYAHDKPITAESFIEAERIGEVSPLSGWNVNGRNMEYLIGRAMIEPDEMGELSRNYNHYMYTWGMNSERMDRYPVDRFVIDEKAGPLPAGSGLYVVTPAKAGKRYYAVVSCRAGVENTADFGPGSALGKPIEETVGPGRPVHQGPGLWGPYFDYPGRRQVYVQWAGPPLAPRQNMACNWSILVPPELKEGQTAPVELYFHSGNFSYAKPRKKYILDSIQIAPHDWPFSGWYGFNDAWGTLKSYARGTVSNHTQQRIIAFLTWAKANFPMDADRIILPGADGAAVLGMNYRDMFAYVMIQGFEGGGKVDGRVLDPEAEMTYARVWGPKSPDIKDDRGLGAWGWAMIDELAKARPGDDMPMFFCTGTSWGGVKKYGKAFGPYYTAMQETRQPLVAGHGWNKKLRTPDKYTALMYGLDITRTTPVPAFANAAITHESLQDGNVNWLFWSDVVDEKEKFAMTVWGSKTFDVTPRRVRHFKVKPGETLSWQAVNEPDRSNPEPKAQSGTAAVDALGLFTIKGVECVSKVTITVTRSK